MLWSGLMAVTMALSVPAVLPAAEEGVPSATKETVKPTAAATVGIFSKYVWRGLGLSDKSVVIQPSATVEFHGVSMNLWGNLDTDMRDQGANSLQWNETDMTLAYGRGFGPVEMGIGYIYYGLDSIPDSQEVFLGLSGDVVLAPTFTVYRETSYYPGWYMTFGLSHSFELTSEGASLDLSGSVGYIDVDGDVGYFDNGLVSLALTLPFGDTFSVSPMVAYSYYLSARAYDVLKEGSVDGDAEHLFGGATASLSW